MSRLVKRRPALAKFDLSRPDLCCEDIDCPERQLRQVEWYWQYRAVIDARILSDDALLDSGDSHES